jgi:hypothetical protein
MNEMNEAGRLRRSGAACAAMVAAFAAIPAVAFTSHHRWIGFACIGIQIVLLVTP